MVFFYENGGDNMEEVSVNIDILLDIYRQRTSELLNELIVAEARLEDMSRKEFELREENLHLREDIDKLKAELYKEAQHD